MISCASNLGVMLIADRLIRATFSRGLFAANIARFTKLNKPIIARYFRTQDNRERSSCLRKFLPSLDAKFIFSKYTYRCNYRIIIIFLTLELPMSEASELTGSGKSQNETEKCLLPCIPP